MNGLGSGTVAILSNLTKPGAELSAGDRFHLMVTGAPNTAVKATGVFPSGVSFDTPFGTTDVQGIFTQEGVEGNEHIGHWQIVWSVGSEPAAAMEFDVLPTRKTLDQLPDDVDPGLQSVVPNVQSIPTWVWVAGALAIGWYAFGRKA